MIIVNFSHPLTEAQRSQIEELSGHRVERIIEVRVQLDLAVPLAPQVAKVIDATGLTPEQWESEAIVVNPPSLSYAAATIISELHGRMGHFPTILCVAPVSAGGITEYRVTQLVDLQQARNDARTRR